VDSVWEQEKLEASLPLRAGQGKMLEKAAESPASSARFVGQFFCCKDLKGRRDHNPNAILLVNLVRSTIVSLFQ
jgi:hypothetical protein